MILTICGARPLIVGIKKVKQGLYNVTIWSAQGYPFSSYSDVKVYVDGESPGDSDELFLEAVRVKYVKERGEVYVYTK